VHPERRQVWPQQVAWLPTREARTYGALHDGVRSAFGIPIPAGRTPLFIHPQPPAAHRRVAARVGLTTLADVGATATASYRTVLAWRGERPPVLLKLSLGARVGRANRAITEYYLVTGIMVSRLLETIPAATRARLQLDWFPEPAGAVDAASGTGWILRHFPQMMHAPGAGDLVPVFSLIAPRGARPPLLVELIHDSGLDAESFVIERLLAPYVRVLAHLLFHEGIQLQGHAQNVLVEVGDAGLTGRIIVRDLVDSSVNAALRLARGLPLPDLAERPARTPFPIVRSVTDYSGFTGRRIPVAARDTVELYGLRAFVWSVNTSLARFVRGYRAARVERAFLELWQEAARQHLRVEPELTARPWGLATDEAIAWYLAHADWRRAGASGGARLPATAEPLPIVERATRRRGPVYDRLESAWGDLYVHDGQPRFFRPAF
jgi:hypothetical protein